jgi:polysaccharide pyruvyl transferase WcaK-like protein
MSAVHELRVSHGKPGRPSRPQGGAAAKTARGRETGIAVFGLFGCGNLGNDGSLESMLLFLREKRPDVRLFCICKVPEVVTENFGIETIPIRLPKSEGIARFLDRIFLKFPGMVMNFIHALRHIRKAGVMVVPGTGILDDFGDRPTGLPFDVFKWCLASRLMGTRIAFVSIGAGPIGNRLSRWLMTSAARMADYRSYRDTGSREFMESVGVDTSLDSMYPDLAFKLKVPQSAPADPLHPLTVGVGVMNYRGWYAFDERGQGVFEGYVAKMAKFVTRLLASGYNVHLLTGDEDDATAVEAVKAALGEADTERLSSEPVHSLHDVFSQVARTDLVVATRFHNVVAALMAGKPVISLSYAAKNDLLLEKMGLGDYCQHVDSFDVALLAEQFSRLAENREEHSRTIVCKVGKFKKGLELQDEFLLSTVLSGSS